MPAQDPTNLEDIATGSEKIETLDAVLAEANSVSNSAVSMITAQLGIVENMLEGVDDEDRKEAVELLRGLIARANEAKSTFEARVERINSPYIPSPELELAVREAGILHRPLLLEGEPGTGKTSLAYWLCGQENLPIIHCRGKSTLTGESVLYEVDHVARLHDATLAQAVPESMREEAKKWEEHIKGGKSANDSEFQSFMAGLENAAKLLNLGKISDVRNYIKFGELGEAIIRASRGEKVILLFDEIDKAKRDFPNDLLDELEHRTMRIRETGEEISAPAENIIVIVTSNHERDLPEAFLRRCVYSYIDFPTPDQMTEIVAKHVPDVGEKLLRDAITRFYETRNVDGLQKRPSTSEMIDWIKVLMDFNVGGIKGKTPNMEVLLKTKDDITLVVKKERAKYEGSWISNDYERIKMMEALGMDNAAIEALRGNLVFTLRSRNGNKITPAEEVILALTNAGIPIAYNHFSNTDPPFNILLDEVKLVAPLTFSIPNRLSREELEMPPREVFRRRNRSKNPERRVAFEEIIAEQKACDLFAVLLQVGMVESKYVVETRSDLQFEKVETSNRYFAKGEHTDGFTFWRTADGKVVYSQLVPKQEDKEAKAESDEELLGAPTLRSIAPDS